MDGTHDFGKHDKRSVPSRRSLAATIAAVLAVVGVASYLATSDGSHPRPHGAQHRTAIGDVARSGVVTGSVTSFGGAGVDLWAVTTTGTLYLTTDGGQSWATITPPVSLAGVRPDEVAVAQYQTSLVWLVAPDGGQEVLFRSENAGKTWSGPEVVASRPSLSPEDQAALATQGTTPDTVYAQLLSPTEGFITLDRSIFATLAIATLDVSIDGGESFDTMVLPTFGRVAFKSPTVGFVAGGPGGQQIYETVDAGSTWTKLGVVGPATANWSLSLPVLFGSGSTATVPVYANGGQIGTELYLVQTNAAARTRGPPLHVAGTTTSSGLILTNYANDLVAMTPKGRHVYRSGSGGASWTTSTVTGLPTGWSLVTIVSTGTGSAVAVATNRSCAATDAYGRKADCSEMSALFSTATLTGGSWTKLTL